MSSSAPQHRIDLFEAVKYDLRLHGFRFITVEFVAAGLGACALAAVELAHAGRGGAPLWGGIWFLTVAVNCLAVVVLIRQAHRLGAGTVLHMRRVQLHALQLVVLLLLPLGVALALAWQWHAGDFRTPTPPDTTKEIL